MKPAYLLMTLLFLLGATSYAQTEPPREQAFSAVRLARCYPNPANAYIQFEIRKTANSPLRLRIYNFLGRKVIDLIRIPATLKVDLTGFARGLYIYQLSDTQGRMLESGKFLVSHG